MSERRPSLSVAVIDRARRLLSECEDSGDGDCTAAQVVRQLLAPLSVERPALSVAAKHGGASRRPRRKEPTAEQWQALRDYAREHGRQWKAHLREDWTTGRDSGFLRQVRNQFGPRWLAKVRFQEET